MSKRIDYSARRGTKARTGQVTTGPRECRECGAQPYRWHATWCQK